MTLHDGYPHPPAAVVVVGSLHLDIMVQAPDRPRRGETLPGTGWWLSPGGKGGNQAVEAARFGADVAMVGRVGDDDFGRRLRAHLQDRGVHAEEVFTDDGDGGAGSGMSVALVDPDGDYGAVIVSGVNGRLGPADLDRAATRLTAARWVVLQNEIPAATNLEAARRARAAGARVLWNAAPARPLEPAMTPLVDVLVVNAVEAEQLTGVTVNGLDDAGTAAKQLVAAGFPTVVVTAGGDGSVLAERGQSEHRVAAYPVAVVNTHGAGDAFIGALAARLSAGTPLRGAVEFANAAAAALVGTPVADRALVTSAHAEKLLRSRRFPAGTAPAPDPFHSS